jgi:hypothetical protein
MNFRNKFDNSKNNRTFAPPYRAYSAILSFEQLPTKPAITGLICQKGRATTTESDG